MTVGADSTTLIQTLLGNLEEVDLLKCFDICEKNRATYAEERDMTEIWKHILIIIELDLGKYLKPSRLYKVIGQN